MRTARAGKVAWRSGRWLLPTLAAVVVVGVVAACSSTSPPRPALSTAGHTQPASPMSVPPASGQPRTTGPPALASSASTAPASNGSAHAATYAAAIVEVSDYLALWAKAGPYAAASTYLVPDEQAPSGANTTWPEPDPDPEAPALVAGSVVSYVPGQWTSTDQFTLYVEMNLTFRGDVGRANWEQGRNWRFFTFTRPDPTSAFRMYIATGP